MGTSPVWLHIFEALLLTSALVVVIGLVGEYKIPWWRLVYDLFTLLVAFGCIGELVADGGVFFLSRHLQEISDIELKYITEKSGQALLDAARANERAANSEKEAAEIQESVAPRRLTAKQRSILTSHLAKFSCQPVAAIHNPFDVEAGTFAADILKALEAAKWNTNPEHFGIVSNVSTLVRAPYNAETGVVIRESGENVVASIALAHELAREGFNATRSTKWHGGDVLIVDIEARPEGPQGEAKLRQQQETKSRKQKNK